MKNKNVGANFVRPKMNKGITLIALVITIIIMLILVAVTVSYGVKSGLLSKAKEGTTGYTYKEEEDEIGEIRLAYKVDKETGKTGDKTLKEYLENELGNKIENPILEKDGNLIIKYKGSKESHTIQNIISEDKPIIGKKSYVGYYADVDGAEDGGPDGIPDGVIFVDLMRETEENKGEVEVYGEWGGINYSYTTITESKEYKIGDLYTGNFGTHPIISLKNGTTGSSRFLVLSLNDSISSVRHHQIENYLSDGWCCPCYVEWAEFCDFICNKIEGTKCNVSNFNTTFGLSNEYWTGDYPGVTSGYSIRFSSLSFEGGGSATRYAARGFTTF